MEKSIIDSYYSFIYPLAMEAGQILLDGYEKERKRIDIKSDFYDVVTDYDCAIEQYLMNTIRNTYPKHKFIAEEETAKLNNAEVELSDEPTWIIDPIDGTSNFIKQIPHTCISIALAIGKQIVLGIVNNPVQGKVYSAKLGQGAFCNDRPIFVSNCEKMKEANVGYEVSLLHAQNIRNKHIKRIYHIGMNSRRLLSYGCVVDSLCLVAAGNLDAYHVEDMFPWDCAAGYFLIREAGGVVTHPYGGAFNIMKPDLICAGTEKLCNELKELICKADKEKSVGGEEDEK